MSENSNWHGTTIVLIRKGKDVVVAGDGQVSLGNASLLSAAHGVGFPYAGGPYLQTGHSASRQINLAWCAERVSPGLVRHARRKSLACRATAKAAAW